MTPLCHLCRNEAAGAGDPERMEPGETCDRCGLTIVPRPDHKECYSTLHEYWVRFNLWLDRLQGISDDTWEDWQETYCGDGDE